MASNVAFGLKIVTSLGTKFAMRSDGHQQNIGFSSNENCVLIDLSRLNPINMTDLASGAGKYLDFQFRNDTDIMQSPLEIPRQSVYCRKHHPLVWSYVLCYLTECPLLPAPVSPKYARMYRDTLVTKDPD